MKKYKIYSWLIILFTLAGSVFFIFEMKNNAYMETDLDEYMPKEHPAFQFSDQAEETFNIQDGILIAIENKEGIYNPKTLQLIRDITVKLQEMDEFEDNDVMSLYTADNIIGTSDGMDVSAFYTEIPSSVKNCDSLRAIVKGNDMVYKRLVSKDETVALINAGMNDDNFSEKLYDEIIQMSKRYEDNDHKILIAGRPIVEGTMGMLGPEDMKRMVPMVLLVIVVVLFVLLKSFRATISTLLTVSVSTIWAFGLMSLTGIPIYSVSTMIPVMLIAIGVAYGIYFYNDLNHHYLSHPDSDRITAIKHTLYILWKPLAMAAFTTIIGFFSLLTSDVYPIKYFGVFSAFGIFVSLLLVLVFVPAFVMLFGSKQKKTLIDVEVKTYTRMNKVTDIILKNRFKVYFISAIVLVLSFIGIQKVWINSSFLDKFEAESMIVQTDSFINKKFGGTSTLNVVLESKTNDAFKIPANLRLMDQMQTSTEKLQKVGNSFSLADYLKRMNKVMNENQEKFYQIPENEELVAQYLLLYEMSGDPENLTKVVNYDYNKTNITFQLKGDDSKTINEALKIIRSYSDEFAKNGITINYAGSGYKALVFSDLILEGQIKSIVMSVIMVFVILIIMFRSIKAGIIGSVPILFTALISFGVMGAFNIPLSTTTALLSSIAIGIGVDYAIHFLENYRHFTSKLHSKHDAVHATMKHTGRAIINNAIVVISGFLVLLFSVFPPNRMLGILVSMNMFTSFIGTLSLMMILVYVSKIFIKKTNKKEL